MAIKPSALEKPTLKEEKPKLTPEERARLEAEKITIGKELLSAEEAYLKGLITIRDLIAPASFRVTPRFIQLGDK